MSVPSLADWRALVQQELGAVPFEKALVSTSAEGLSIQPLYVDTPAEPGRPLRAPRPVRCTMRHDTPDPAALRADLDGGADALWIPAWTPAFTKAMAEAGVDQAKTLVVTDGGAGDAPVISTLAVHAAGADAADELAIMLSLAVDALRAGHRPETLGFRVAVGRDTFGELAKLRAARLLWQKVAAAAGATTPQMATMATLHGVAAWRTLSQRDPWVNMLRVTSQAFAAILGGVDLFTPHAFDDALSVRGELGRRVARNTVLVLRDESHLGRVADPAAGAYYLETRTDQLARLSWTRFQALEQDGGATKLLAAGALARQLAAAWDTRAEALGRRKEPITGVSEFPNLGERLPAPPSEIAATAPASSILPRHRDAERFEALRDRAERLGRAARVSLSLLGPKAEHRARVGFARGFFSVAGLACDEHAEVTAANVACVCGSDERYQSDAVARVRDLKAAGVKHVLLAGRPGAAEAELVAAGVDGFIFLGCDVPTHLAAALAACTEA
jgi:methylmalonyl-CoA mutase